VGEVMENIDFHKQAAAQAKKEQLIAFLPKTRE
jgi:hypothetical protein